MPNEALDNWWPDYWRVVQAWSQRPEAKGGLHAIAGFGFQVASALLEMVRTEKEESRARIFLESLSDITTVKGVSVVITQAKLT